MNHNKQLKIISNIINGWFWHKASIKQAIIAADNIINEIKDENIINTLEELKREFLKDKTHSIDSVKQDTAKLTELYNKAKMGIEEMIEHPERDEIERVMRTHTIPSHYHDIQRKTLKEKHYLPGFLKKAGMFAIGLLVAVGVAKADVASAQDSVGQYRNKDGSYSQFYQRGNYAYTPNGQVLGVITGNGHIQPTPNMKNSADASTLDNINPQSKIHKVAPINPQPTDPALDYINSAKELYKNDKQAAIAKLEEAKQKFPNNDQIHMFLGEYYLRDKAYSKSALAYEEAIKINKNNARILKPLIPDYKSVGITFNVNPK